MKCGECAHYRQMGDRPGQGQCRESSPQAQLIGNPIAGGEPRVFTFWPGVAADDPGCSQFEEAVEDVDPESLS